ncbi:MULTISPECIES: SDR family NAD(P)-dependent oxidoreductase [Amycolatopsis]|uniref:SDR family NAD(P)-dependent oxidoreductase n=1 Tax=Amycolatopsis TaxID=1813 RepID=UPI000B8B3825|nr:MULTISPECIES: SDR family oxidoreductase [Amycolatopsis]OXM67492.1 3-ketoacyl-ACP reductase [Amycolatopsis sp. KNN50.9b]
MEESPIVVVGASSGIGLRTALDLAEAGRPVVAAARASERLAALRRRAERQQLPLVTRTVDVTSAPSVEELFTDLPLAGCVITTGRNLSRQLVRRPRDPGVREWARHPEDEWREVIDFCLTGTFLVGREAAAALARRNRGGVLVTVASSTWRGSWGQSAYSAAKAGVVSLTRSWALELADYGIRVVCVAPGVVDGAALRTKTTARPAHAEYMERLRGQVPLRRFARESEIAATIVHAIDNGYMTGNVLEVDGGGFPGRIA